MKKVLLRAPLLTNSGYGVHSRQVFEWLHGREDVDLTVECLQWGRTAWILDSKSENGIIEKIMNCSKPVEKGSYDISYQVQLPDEWDTTLAKKNVGVTALVETDKCSTEWVDKCNKMDTIIVPSTFTKNVLKRSGVLMKPVFVVPEWFNSVLNNKSTVGKVLNDKRFSKLSNKFNILAIGTLTSQDTIDDRKNLGNTIKWLCEEFKNDQDVGIVLKTNLGKGTTIDRSLCKKYVEEMISRYRKGSFPKIHFLHGNMKKEEVAALFNHNNVKMYVSATRGEGYGLPLIEAAATGLPIVATGWSGHLEFLDKELFGAVDYELVEISTNKIDDRVFKEGFRWADPDEDSFKQQCRNTYENYSQAKEKAKTLKKNILINFNSTCIKKQYDKIFEGLV